MKTFLAALCFAIGLAPVVAAADDPALGSNLQGLLDYARANPEFAASQSEAAAASERVEPAGALPDPVLRVEPMDITNGGNSSPNILPGRVGSTKYTLMQTLPWFGKRDLRRGLAEAEADQAKGRVEATWADIASGIKAQYARYYLAVRSEALAREVLDLLDRLERVARVRYESGLAAQQDVIRAQVEITGVRTDLLALESDREMARAQLNAALGRDPLAPLADPLALPPVPPPARLEAPALIAKLKAHAPDLFVEDARVAAAEKNRDLVLRNRYPDVTAGIAPSQMGSKISQWDLMLEVSIPLQQGTRRHQESEAQAMLDAARERKQAVGNRLIGAMQENLAALASAQRTAILVSKSLLPQADATLQSAMVGYENGKVDFATLLDAQRQIRNAKLARLKAEVEVQVRAAAIEKILGEDL